MFLAYIDPGSGYVLTGFLGWILAFFLGFFSIFILFFKKIYRFFRRHKKVTLITILVIIISILITLGVFMRSSDTILNKKIIILGFDGLSPDILEPMMKEGKLPNFTRLKAKGSYRHLSTTNPPQSPVAWTGFSTGKNPGKHGIYDFIIRDPETYALDLSVSKIEKGKARRTVKSKFFWEYTSEKKIPTVIINCPITFPPDKVHGRMLSGMGVPDILGTQGTFSFLTTEKVEEIKAVSGNIFEVKKDEIIECFLTGPRKALTGDKTENIKVPFKVSMQEEKDSVVIEYQNNKFELKKGNWSDWKAVTFKLDLLRKIKGIFKFYLTEVTPELKLYVSPIEYDPREPFFQISHPHQYSKELADEIGLFHTRGMPFDTWAVNEKRLAEGPFLKQVENILEEKKAMLDLELSRCDSGVLFCYFESSDIIQHMFWRYTDNQHPLYEEDAPQEYKEMIQTWYKKLDDILGNVMQKTGDEDTLIVLSDHGFDTFRRSVHINTWLRENGYLELNDPDSGSGKELLDDVDWQSTRAYALGFGAIYINQRGREGEGIVNPGKETESLKKEISAKLKQWIDEKYDTPVINNVYTRKEIFWGDLVNQTPDIYLGFNKGYRASWQTALGAVPEELIEDNLKKWSGCHLFDPELVPGILFLNRKINTTSPTLYDITPTILEICDFDKEELRVLDFDGKSLL